MGLPPGFDVNDLEELLSPGILPAGVRLSDLDLVPHLPPGKGLLDLNAAELEDVVRRAVLVYQGGTTVPRTSTTTSAFTIVTTTTVPPTTTRGATTLMNFFGITRKDVGFFYLTLGVAFAFVPPALRALGYARSFDNGYKIDDDVLDALDVIGDKFRENIFTSQCVEEAVCQLKSSSLAFDGLDKALDWAVQVLLPLSGFETNSAKKSDSCNLNSACLPQELLKYF